jgi:hypothetical protein
MAAEYKTEWIASRIAGFLDYCERQRQRYDPHVRAHYLKAHNKKAADDQEAVESGKIAFPVGDPIEVNLRSDIQMAVYEFLCAQTEFVLPKQVVAHLADRFGDKPAQVFSQKKHIYWWFKRGHIVRGPRVIDSETGRLVYRIAIKRKVSDAG